MSNHIPDDHFHYGCFPRTPRRSPAVPGSNSGSNSSNNNNTGGTRRGLFHLGQGPFFRTHHQEPSPVRNDYNTQTYGQTGWTGNQIPGGHQSTSFAPDPRSYAQQYGYTNRPSPSPGASNPNLGPSNVRSPVSGYPAGYNTYPQNSQPASSSYPYVPAPDPRVLPPSVPPMGFDSMGAPVARRTSMSVDRTSGRLSSVHGPSPYARGPQTMPVYAPEAPVSEPTIKKKRKRADAEQLKVLNETYNRTAFPSTEERNDLAKRLGMSARSVQIWFQNKRQAMRQSTRQTSTSMPPSVNDPFGASSHGPSISPVSAYGNPSSHSVSSQAYGVARHDVPTLQPMPTRLIPSPAPSSHRRARSPEGDERLRRFPSRPPY